MTTAPMAIFTASSCRSKSLDPLRPKKIRNALTPATLAHSRDTHEARAKYAAAPPLRVGRVEHERGEPHEREPAEAPGDLARPAPRPQQREEAKDHVGRVHEEAPRRREQETVEAGLDRCRERLDAVALFKGRAERE